MAKLSIIVPIYNAGVRLTKLLDSLLSQTEESIDIICVLDCPTDGSDEVCKEYAKKDKRFVILDNNTNLGISTSRNRGIEEAIRRGSQYIGFADHDDFLEYNAYESMLSKANSEGNVDVLFANTIIENEDQTNREVHFNDPTWHGLIKSLLLPMNSSRNSNYLVRSVWNAIYRVDFIRENEIKFLDRFLYLEEDTLFNLEVYSKTKNVHYLDQVVYHWVRHNESASEMFNPSDKVCDMMLNFLEQELKIIRECRLYDFVEYFYLMISDFLWCMNKGIRCKNVRYKQRLGYLLKECNFPLLGRFEDKRIISRTRFKLFFLVIALKYRYN